LTPADRPAGLVWAPAAGGRPRVVWVGGWLPRLYGSEARLQDHLLPWNSTA